MRCTDRSYNASRSARARRNARARRRRKRMIRRMIVLLILLCVAAAGAIFVKFNFKEEQLAAEYEASNYNKSIYRGALYSADLCVVTEDISGTPTSESTDAPDSAGDAQNVQNVQIEGNHLLDTNTLKAFGLFSIDDKTAKLAYNVHEKMYPASLTKIMTALVTLESKDVNLSDTVTVSANADSGTFAADEQVCGIKAGDKLTLEDLLYGLLLYSGNDNAVAIAEYVGGSSENFAEMMNKKAKEIMATHTHFVNANGLHNDDHYTTAYDMYLIFNECIKNEKFVEIIEADSYKVNVSNEDGSERELAWEPSNFYALGQAKLPKSGKIIGGKTGTTLKAGNCLILLVESDSQKPYISIVMGAATKDILYQDMTAMIEGISDGE